jgi:lipid-A-disaccharide synthase
MIVAGEASGDAHAARLVKRLRESSPQTTFEFFGATGEKLRGEGVETVVKADNFSIVGLPEIARALPMFWQAFQVLKKAAATRKPDAIILVDFPDFNLKLAKALKKQNFKIVYYISPQLWAWRKYRVKTIKSSVDLMLTILPFEKKWYTEQEVSHVEYVGNPLAGEVKSRLTKEEFCAEHNLDSHKPIITLLAGSRRKEIVRILPVLLETASLMTKSNADIQFIVALAATRSFTEVETAIADAKKNGLPLPKTLIVVKDETFEALTASDAAAVTSGTATLETAIIGTPLAIVYKTSPFNYSLLRPLINVENFGLINLIARETVAKEFIQNEFNAENLSAELFRLLDKEENQKIRQRLNEVAKTLGAGGTARRAAAIILKYLRKTR